MYANNPFNFSAGVHFGEKPAKSKRDSLDALDGVERTNAEEYRARANQERKRYRHATDTEYWLCLCFRDRSALAAGAEALGVPDAYRQIIPYRDVEPVLGAIPHRAMSFGGLAMVGEGPAVEREPDPLAAVEYTDDLQTDCLRELTALHEAMIRAGSPQKMTDVTDSEHWIVIAWPDRDLKDRYIADHGLKKLGDKYIDGAAWLRALGI